jgi:Bacterial Ig-like domain (group 3)
MPASASVTCSSGACSGAFSYKGAVEEWTVPNGVSSIGFTVKGAGGGGFFGSGHGGAGAKVSSTLAVASAAKLKLVVGGGGDDFIEGGYGGGARGGFGFEPGPGGGGGSFVFSEADSLLIAAGGGGGAGFRSNAKGGSGGHDGTAGEAGGASGGGGATTSAGGTAGEHAQAGKGPTTTATGLQGEGGFGAEFEEGGGGGGGGYYGGGGGGDNSKLFESGGGGGGSSTVNGGSSTSYETGAGGAGGNNFESGHNGEIAISFTQPATITSLGASSTTPGLDHPVTYTATVAPVPSGGTVAFENGGSTIVGCSAQTVSTITGEATCTTEYGTPGVRSVTAEYSGSPDTIYPASGSSSKQVVVSTPTGTTLEASNPAPALEALVTYTATVTPVPSSGGTVAFTDGGHAITGCSAQAVNTSTGEATCTTEYPAAGVHSIGAEYSGSPDTVYEASASSSRQVVATASTTTTLEASSTQVPVGTPLTITATVSPVPSGGTVGFSDGESPIPGCEEQPVDTSSGTAQCLVEYRSTGEHSIGAAFSGSPDSAYTSSSSQPALVSVVAPVSPPVVSGAPAKPAASSPVPASEAPSSSTQPGPPAQPALLLLSDVAQPLINTRAIGLRVTCGNVSCVVRGEAWVKLPGMRHALWLSAGTSSAAPNRGSTVRLLVPRNVRGLVRRYMLHHRSYKPQIKLTLTVMGASPDAGAGAVPLASREYTLGIWTYPGLR